MDDPFKQFERLEKAIIRDEHPRRRRRRRITVLVLIILAGTLLIIPPFVLPVDGPVSSRFLPRIVPENRHIGDWEMHYGLDFAVPAGNAVRASALGRIRRTGFDENYGYYVEIGHLFGFMTKYGHLSRIDVKAGRFCPPWKIIGRSGTTGRATGPHLHFEIRWRSRPLPPGPFLLIDGLRRRLIHLFIS